MRALRHALEQKRLHHAYLFTGTRGVGKTTLARILAKCLNCETGITPEPCGKCSACLEIDGGRFVDLIEVDAATNTKVDEMRAAARQRAQYAPTRGRFKVYVIDEVHMLSNSAFNAMLKTLEEPPEHLKFILATTDPQKIPVTVLSRCLQFNLKQMPRAAIAAHLQQAAASREDRVRARGAAADRARRRGQHARRAVAARPGDRARRREARRRQACATCWARSTQSYLLRLLEALAAQRRRGDCWRSPTRCRRAACRSTRRCRTWPACCCSVALAQAVPDALEADLPERERILALAAAHRPGERAALLPDRAAGPRGPAARARRARRIRHDAAAHARVSPGRRLGGCWPQAGEQLRRRPSDAAGESVAARERRSSTATGRSWCAALQVTGAARELARNRRWRVMRTA